MVKGEKGIVCVTGAGGVVGSWVVNLLLSKGYKVHGTVRDPSDEKNAFLKKLKHASKNLQIFKADLLDYDALSVAIGECEGVFHVASPVVHGQVFNPEEELLAPAIEGTRNVLMVSSAANVKRCVLVSSVAAVGLNPSWPQHKVKDENCWSNKEACKTTQNWYCLSKTVAEEEALKYAENNSLEIVTICPCTVIGPLLQPKPNPSSWFLINLLKGGHGAKENQDRHFVDVRDVAESLILTYEKFEATGRYVCAPHPITLSDFVGKLKNMYPNYNYPEIGIEVAQKEVFSSEKLKSLGWKYRTLEDTLKDSVECYQVAGLLNKT